MPGDRRATRRMPLMCLRARAHGETPDTTMPEPPLKAGVQEPLVREALRFLFVRSPDGPFSIMLRFLVA